MKHAAFRILAIEPDAGRGERLRALVCERFRAHVSVVHTAEAAIAVMKQDAPDVILTSALVPPEDEARLIEYLKRLNVDPPLIIVPPMVDLAAWETARRSRGSIFARRKTSTWLPYHLDAIGTRIDDALAQSRTKRSMRSIRLVKSEMKPQPAPPAPITTPSVVLAEPVSNRPRAHRFAPADLPWLLGVRMPLGLEARVLNISRSGMLIESHSKLAPDTTTEFRLCGPDKTLVVAGRVVRSEVAVVDVRGVKYHTAAVFDGRLDLLPDGPAPLTQASAIPEALADLVARVVADLGRGREVAATRAMFEQELRTLVSAVDVKLREAPERPAAAHDSIYFSVPNARGSHSILQIVFGPNHEPTIEEFKLLKSAASLAGVFHTEERPRSVVPASTGELELLPAAVGARPIARLAVRGTVVRLRNSW